MAKKSGNRKLTDERLGVVVDQKIQEATAWFTSKLSVERERVMRYYNGELPKRQSAGSSTFISTDVYDGVEMMKAQLLETFAAGREIVKFDPQSQADVIDAATATAYCDYIVFRENDGYQIFDTVIHDGLIARNGIAKVYWDERVERVEEEFENYSEPEVHALAALDEVERVEADLDEETGLYKGKITRKADTSQVVIEPVNPEEFCVEPQARDLSKKYFCVHRTLKTIDELVKMGFSRKDLQDASDEDETVIEQLPEVLARFQQLDSGWKLRLDDEQEDTRHVLVNEAYILAEREGDDYAKYYQVIRVGQKTLQIQEVDDHPFLTFTPLPIPHSFYGNNFGDRIVPYQNAHTNLIRSIIDHTAITVNPRLQVLKGGLTNPRELLDNRLGGVVNVTRPDAISPVPQPNLNPYVYQTMELLKAEMEQTTGISALSQGLNKDAISKQNSGAMVEQLVNLSQTRQKVIARNFANNFLIPLYLKIYNIVLMKEKRKRIIELAGQWHEVDTERWTTRKAATASLHLGYGEQDREAQKLVEVGQLLNQDPELQTLFQIQGRYELALDVGKLRGIAKMPAYLTSPDKVPPKQPDPMQQMEMQIKQQEAQAKLMTAQSNQEKVQLHGQIEKLKMQLSDKQQQFDNQIKLKDETRKDHDIANKIDISQREMHIAESTPVSEETTVVSPH